MKIKAILAIMTLCFITCLTGLTRQANAADIPGLIGIQYSDEDFEKPESLVTLESLDQNWGQSSGFGLTLKVSEPILIMPVPARMKNICSFWACWWWGPLSSFDHWLRGDSVISVFPCFSITMAYNPALIDS